MIIPTMKVKPWGKDQGDYVEINVGDFDPEFHVALDPLDHNGNGEPGGSLPRRGRPKKVAA